MLNLANTLERETIFAKICSFLESRGYEYNEDFLIFEKRMTGPNGEEKIQISRELTESTTNLEQLKELVNHHEDRVRYELTHDKGMDTLKRMVRSTRAKNMTPSELFREHDKDLLKAVAIPKDYL